MTDTISSESVEETIVRLQAENDELRSVVHALSEASYRFMRDARMLGRFFESPDSDGSYHHGLVVLRGLLEDAQRWVDEGRAARGSSQYDRVIGEKYAAEGRVRELEAVLAEFGVKLP